MCNQIKLKDLTRDINSCCKEAMCSSLYKTSGVSFSSSYIPSAADIGYNCRTFRLSRTLYIVLLLSLLMIIASGELQVTDNQHSEESSNRTPSDHEPRTHEKSDDPSFESNNLEEQVIEQNDEDLSHAESFNDDTGGFDNSVEDLSSTVEEVNTLEEEKDSLQNSRVGVQESDGVQEDDFVEVEVEVADNAESDVNIPGETREDDMREDHMREDHVREHDTREDNTATERADDSSPGVDQLDEQLNELLMDSFQLLHQQFQNKLLLQQHQEQHVKQHQQHVHQHQQHVQQHHSQHYRAHENQAQRQHGKKKKVPTATLR